MPGSKLDQLLARVVERKGYTVQGADAEALFARKGDDLLLAAWKTDSPVTAVDAQIFLAAFGQVHATTGVLVAPRGADQAATAALNGAGVEVWPEDRLIVEVGEAYVRDALEAPATPPTPTGPAAFPTTPPSAPAQASGSGRTNKFPSLVAQAASASNTHSSGAAMYMPNKKKEQPADMQAQIPQRGSALGYAWGGIGSGAGGSSPGIAQVRSGRHPSKKVDQWGNLIDPAKEAERAAAAAARAAPAAMEDVEIISTPKKGRAAPAATPAPAPAPSKVINADAEAYEIITTKKPAAAPAAAAMKTTSAPACSTLKLTVSKEDAIAKTGKPGNAKLALVPHVAFEFDLEMNRPGMTAPVTGKGAILVSSLTGELRTVDGLDFADAEPTDARKDAEKLTAVDVYDKVKGHMSKTYTRTLNVERELAGNTVMETMKLTPDPEEMGLNHRGIIHLPVWEVTGSTGVTKVDAYTGNVLG